MHKLVHYNKVNINVYKKGENVSGVSVCDDAVGLSTVSTE